MTKHTLKLAVVVLAAPSLAFCTEWGILGPRPLGMGGAFVAVAEGPIAQYWNPAALAQPDAGPGAGFQMPVGAHAEFTGGVLQKANTLGELASQFSTIKSAQTSGTAGKFDANAASAFLQGVVALNGMNQGGKGVLADVAGGGNFRIGRYALSVNNFTMLGATPYVDTVNIGLGAASGINGVAFTGANTNLCGGSSCITAPGNASQAAAATTIANSVNFSNLDALTGGKLTAGGITNSAQLGNALVNMAATNGATTQQIVDAANQIAANAGAAAPILAAAASGNPYTNNKSNLTIRGGSFTELAIGTGRYVPWVKGLKAGGNLKAILGYVGYSRFDVLQKDSGTTNALKDYKSNAKSSIQPALDLGALWNMSDFFPVLPWRPRVGLVARNINNPGFANPDLAKQYGEGNAYHVNGQIRSGVALSPFNWWHVAMDMDLTENTTPVQGYKSRLWGLGTEINVVNKPWFNLPLRAGLSKNLANSDSKLAYHAGFGLNFLHVIFDLGAQVSSDRTTIKQSNNTQLPSNLGFAAQLALLF